MSVFLYNDSELQMDTILILCIEEIDDGTVDNRIFIGYDINDNNFYVRGKREDTTTSNTVPYALCCNDTIKLYNLIKFIIGDNKINIMLYNFNNIDKIKTNNLTYDFFEVHMDKNYEICGYDNARLTRRQFETYLGFLSSTYNWEN